MTTPRRPRAPKAVSMRKGFDASVAAARHVQADGVHAGAVAAGQMIATQIDTIVNDPEVGIGDKTKAMYLVPHVMGILRELLLTPASVAQRNPGKAATADDDEGEDVLGAMEQGHSGPRLVS